MTERCECCGQEIKLAKCKHTNNCGFGFENFPFCLCGDGRETPFTGHKIKTTEEALRKRGYGVCSNYEPDTNITQKHETIKETIKEILNNI